MTSVLDAWALLAWLEEEPAAPRVEATVALGGALASWINLGELYYNVVQRHGAAAAATGIERVLQWVQAEAADGPVVLDAARIKAAHRLSYADAFAVATAERHNAPLLTGDPEILALKRRLTVIDLRSGP